ncbi:MAG: hypothetical protein LBL26_12210 [Peptococcaceae bacterium]|jgi:hypothetical protein|nr:hypothetical protein [Peptococcaceae bacterium]
MATNLSIDTELLDAALEVGDILTLFGTIKYDADYDYKEARWRGDNKIVGDKD